MKPTVLLLIITLLLSALTGQAEVPREKRFEIDRMLELTGMERMVEQMMTQMLADMRSSMKGAPEGFWEGFTRKVTASELIELIVPLYDKYYSLEDLRAVNAFYSSAVGQRMMRTLPQVMQESMEIGRRWGEEMGHQLAAEAIAARKTNSSSAQRP